MKIRLNQLNASIRSIPLPDYMKELPVSREGFPVPHFVANVDGEWDFRVVRPETAEKCIRKNLCWVCGQPLSALYTFVVGPMCVVTRTSAEPPSHYVCATYSAVACPFLTQPRMKRNKKELPEGRQNPPGEMIERNPGVVAVLRTASYKIFRDEHGSRLIEMGSPKAVEWYAERRKATRAEVMASILSGFPILEKMAKDEGPEAEFDLSMRLKRTMSLVPEKEI